MAEPSLESSDVLSIPFAVLPFACQVNAIYGYLIRFGAPATQTLTDINYSTAVACGQSTVPVNVRPGRFVPGATYRASKQSLLGRLLPGASTSWVSLTPSRAVLTALLMRKICSKTCTFLFFKPKPSSGALSHPQTVPEEEGALHDAINCPECAFFEGKMAVH